MNFDVTGIGRAFTDIIAEVDDDFLKESGLIKGRGIETLPTELLAIRSQLTTYTLLPGGSPSNTVAGVAALGGKAAFLGKVCEDISGRAFRNAFQRGEVFFPNSVYPDEPNAISATCFVLSTPDGTITMAYSRGIADRLTTKDVFPDIIAESKVLLIQGHLFNSPESREAILFATKVAERAKRKVAISLNDLYLKPAHDRSFLAEADFIFANMREFRTEFPGKELIDLQNQDAIFIVTDGARGAHISGKGHFFHCPPLQLVPDEHVAVPNFVGAGDQFAAGFLFGYTHDVPLPDCARLGSETAAAVLRAHGARPKGDWRGLAAKYLQPDTVDGVS